MSDKDRRAPSPDYGDWNAALDAVDRLAITHNALRDEIDEAQLERDIAAIRKAVLALSEPLETRDVVPGTTRKRWLGWVLLGGIWIAMAAIAWASFGTILRFLR